MIKKMNDNDLEMAALICDLPSTDNIYTAFKIYNKQSILGYYFIFKNQKQAVFNNHGEKLLISKDKSINDYPFHRILKFENDFRFYNDFVANLITRYDNYGRISYEIELKTYYNDAYYNRVLNEYESFDNIIRYFKKNIESNLNL